MAWLTPENSLIWIVGLFLFLFIPGSLAPLLLKPKERGVFVSLVLAGLGSFTAIASGVYFLWKPTPFGQAAGSAVSLIDRFPPLSLEFYADRLAAFFLLLTGALSLGALLHLVEWLRDHEQKERIAFVFNLFVLSILLTILANTTFFFLVGLECMTLTFAYLALFRHNQYLESESIPPEAIQAAKTAFKTYLIFEHVGAVLLMLALLVLSVQVVPPESSMDLARCPGLSGPLPSPAGFDFDVARCLARNEAAPGGATGSGIFLLALVGLGIKAGLFPAHIWVPLVHPYSPTSVHAMMSGIVLKVSGLYGMYRIFFTFLGPGEWWWGMLVLLIAGATALAGVYYATFTHDLKTALASHSVENIGIIVAGIGMALIYRWAADFAGSPQTSGWISAVPWSDAVSHYPEQYGVMASKLWTSFRRIEYLALLASLYHLLNHSIFKSLLFFGTGAIENRTGVTAMDRLGGLIKRYRWTSATFLVGAVSIAGFPPFNGFISEWLTLQALFAGMNLYLPGMPPRIYFLIGFVLALVLLASSFGLTALAFVKIAGETLLGAPRDLAVAQRSKTGDVGWHIRTVLLFLAFLCLLLGMFPAQTANGLGFLVEEMMGGSHLTVLQTHSGNLSLSVTLYQIGREAAIDAPGVIPIPYSARISARFLWVLLIALALPFGMYAIIRRTRWSPYLDEQKGPVWTGGVPFKPEMMQQTGPALSSMVWLSSEESSSSELPAGTDEGYQYLPSREKITAHHSVRDVFRFAYSTAIARLHQAAQLGGDTVQNGDIRRSLVYIAFMFTLILLSVILINGL